MCNVVFERSLFLVKRSNMKIILFTVMMICYYVFNKRGYLVDNIAVKKPSAELWH